MKATEIKPRVAPASGRSGRIAITPSATVSEAASLMNKHGIHHLLVMEGERFVGILEAASIVLFSLAGTADSPDIRVEAVMRRDVPAIDEKSDVRDAVRRMLDHGVTALPMTQSGQVVGILTETDLLHLLNEMLLRWGRLDQLVESGETLFSNPHVQNLLKSLSDAGI